MMMMCYGDRQVKLTMVKLTMVGWMFLFGHDDNVELMKLYKTNTSQICLCK